MYLRAFEDMFGLTCDPAGTRTQGPNIKSVVLYQLSYEINLLFFKGVQKYSRELFTPKLFLSVDKRFFCLFIQF
jgi:hypothetical protein